MEELIARAAELRVAGEKWLTVAAELGRSVQTVTGWPNKHPELWKKHYARAVTEQLKDASSEAMHTLRKLMRSPHEEVQQLAAQKILQLREAREKAAQQKGKPVGSPVPEVRQLVDYLEGMTHEQFYNSFGLDPPAAVGGAAEPVDRDPPRPRLAE